tara:strand:- start:2441 stop:3799 length:1359 start_codon:yes stop_codon:yes gene_type:complete
MAWYNNILGTGTNVFGAGTSMDMDKYKEAGLLEKTDLEKAQKQSLTRGLLGTAIGYLAQPQNQNYGSITPYLAKGFQQGMKSAQEPYNNLQKTADTNAKLDTIITNKENTNAHAKSIDTFIASHPEYAGIKNMPMEQQAEIMKDFYKPVTPNETAINKEKTVKALAGQIMQQNPGMSPSEAEGKARIQIAMKPAMTSTINTGDKLEDKIQMGSRAFVDKQLDEISSETNLGQKMAYASELVEQAGSDQGFGSDFKQNAMAFFDYVGKQTGVNIVPAGSDRSHFIRALKSAQVELALGSKKPGTGPMTDNDFIQLLNSTVQIGNPQATNRIISYVSRRRAEFRKQYARDLMAYVQENGYGDHVRSFQLDWDDKYTKLMKEEMMGDIKTLGKGGILQYQRDRMADLRVGGSKVNGRKFEVYKDRDGNITEAYYANGQKLPDDLFNQWKAQWEGK